MKSYRALIAAVWTAALLAADGVSGQKTEEKPWRQITAVTHIHSRVSPHGQAPLETVAALARKRGMDVLIPTDHFLFRWEYGLSPFTGIFRAALYRSCVYKFGPQAYLGILDKIAKAHPDLVVIPGLEVCPAYRWSGHPAKKNLTLHEPQRHLLVIGLSREDDIRSLPVLSNPAAGTIAWKRLVLPALAVGLGLSMMVRWPGGLLVVVLGLLWAVNQRPLRRLPAAFTDFTRNGYDAAQALIDDVNRKGGLALWAHPEATNWREPQKLYRGAYMQTAPYPEAVLETRRHAGFGYFWEGHRTVGPPGGLWDKALAAFLEGKREGPIWAFGELDWTDENRLGVTIDRVQNVLWVREKTAEDALEALRLGRFYVYWREHEEKETRLSGWKAEGGESAALSGEKTAWTPGARIWVSLENASRNPIKVRGEIIRNGTLWKSFEGAIPFDGAFPLPAPGPAGDAYRLVVKGGGIVVSNPIFIIPHPVEKAPAPPSPTPSY